MAYPSRCLLAWALLGLCSAAASELPPARWEGVLRLPRRAIPLVLDLARDGDQWRGSITLVGLGLKGAPLAEVRVREGEFSAVLADALVDAQHGPARLQAKLQPDGQLSAEFQQGGNTAAVALRRTGEPLVERAPASTSVARGFEGDWQGEYELLGYPRKVTLKLQNQPGGPARAEFVIVGRRRNEVPVSRLVQQSEFLTLEARSFGLTFEGRLEPSGGELRGVLLQGPLEIPLTLRRPH